MGEQIRNNINDPHLISFGYYIDNSCKKTPPHPLNCDNFKGRFLGSGELSAAFPVGKMPWFAFVLDTKSFWYWSEELEVWVNQNINEENYLLLSLDARASVPYVIIP